MVWVIPFAGPAVDERMQLKGAHPCNDEGVSFEYIGMKIKTVVELRI